jgi:hypothetical protein
MRLGVLWMVVCGIALGAPVEPQWNPDGFNWYRLFRISKPRAAADILGDFDKLISQTHLDQGLNAEEARARLAVMDGSRQILGNEIYNRLYQTFSDALDNRYLKAAADLTLPNIDPLFIEYASKSANPIAEGKGAGLVHYAYFHEFFTLQQTNPEAQPTNFEDLGRAFNLYLIKKGITGFQYQLERAISSKPNSGFFSEFLGHLPMMKVAASGAAVTCATLIGAAVIYSGYFGNETLRAPTPAQDVQQMQTDRVDPQVKADQDAQDFGRETARDFLSPTP